MSDKIKIETKAIGSIGIVTLEPLPVEVVQKMGLQFESHRPSKDGPGLNSYRFKLK